MSMVHVAARFDLFRADADCLFSVPHGETVAELVERCRPPEWFPLAGHVAIRTAAGVAEIPRENWHRVRPKPGVAVAVYVLPMGGAGRGGGGRSSGKNVLTTVATLAVLAAATAVSAGLLGPAAAGTIGTGLLGSSFAAGGIGATLLGAGIGIVGSLAINALAPPPIAANAQSAQSVSPASSGVDSVAQRIAGVNGNALSRGSQVPCIVGTMVASPPLLARPYTSFENGDSFAHAVVGLWGRHDVQDIKINGTDVALVPDLDLEVFEGLPSDGKITLAPNTIIEDRTVGQLSEWKLDRTNVTTVQTPSDPASSFPIWHYATTDGSADRVVIRVNFPSGIVWNDTATGTQSRLGVPLRIAMRRVGDTAWIKLPEIHYSDPDATVRAITQQITIDWESRVPNQKTTLNTSFYSYRAYGFTGGGAGSWTPDSYFVSSPTEYLPENTSITADGVIFHLADSAIPRGQYEIRVMRGLAYTNIAAPPASHPGRLFDSADATVPIAQRDKVSTIYVETVQTFRQAYPINQSQPLTLIAIKGRGLQLESISATFTSYAPLWTGSAWASTASPTNNPAAIYRRMLTDYHAVTGKLPASMRDDAGLGAWFEHCAAKGYEVNAVLDGGTLQENLQLVAAAGWALPLFGQTWGVIIERDRSAETPVQLMTPLTGRGLQWEKAFDALPHAIAAEFTDASRGYVPRDDVFIYRSGFDALNATDYETVNYKGITSEAQARARAKLDMGQLLYRRTTYKLEIWIEHLMARRGDLVLLSHDSLGTRYAFARIVEVTRSGPNIVSVRLDQAIEIPAGPGDLFSMGDLFGGGGPTPWVQTNMVQSNFVGAGQLGADLFRNMTSAAVAIRHSTGQSITYPVADPAGGFVLTFDAPFADPGTILPGCVVAVGARGLATRRCLVFDVQRTDLETATVTLIDEAPQLYM
jgi:hypothetical protein